MHTYTFNFWAIPTLVSSQKIQSQCGAVDLSLVLWCSYSKVKCLIRIRCFLWDHINIRNCLGNVQLSRCRGCGLSQIWCSNLPYEFQVRDIITWRNQTLLMSVNQNRGSEHIPIGLVTPYSTSQPIRLFSYATSRSPSPESKEME